MNDGSAALSSHRPRGQRAHAMGPSFVGWGLGALLVALAPPLFFSLGLFAGLFGLIVIVWVTVRAPRYGATGFLGALTIGLALGFAVLRAVG